MFVSVQSLSNCVGKNKLNSVYSIYKLLPLYDRRGMRRTARTAQWPATSWRRVRSATSAWRTTRSTPVWWTPTTSSTTIATKLWATTNVSTARSLPTRCSSSTYISRPSTTCMTRFRVASVQHGSISTRSSSDTSQRRTQGRGSGVVCAASCSSITTPWRSMRRYTRRRRPGSVTSVARDSPYR